LKRTGSLPNYREEDITAAKALLTLSMKLEKVELPGFPPNSIYRQSPRPEERGILRGDTMMRLMLTGMK
jgi:hypothetical protein